MFKSDKIILAFIAAVVLMLGAQVSAFGQNSIIKGTVRNGTTGAVVAADTVKLMSFNTGSMSFAGERIGVSSFTFDKLAPSKMAPYLVQALYKGVKYNANVPLQSGDETVETEITVYEPTTDASVIQVEAAQFFFRNLDANLQVVKLYRVSNKSETPRTYVDAEGSFRFYVAPESNGIDFVTVKTGTVPLNQTPFETKDHGVFAIDYPLKPGMTEITISYSVGYENRRFAFSEKQLYNIPEVYTVIAPANMSIEGEGLEELEHDTQRDLRYYKAPGITSGDNVSYILSEGTSAQRVMWKSNQVAEDKWIYISALAIIFIAAVLLSRNKIPFSRQRRKNVPKKLQQQKEELLKSLAGLDDDFALKRVAETEYRQKRGLLKSRLVELYKKIDSASPNEF